MSSYSVNSLRIRHQDPSYIDRIVTAFNKNELFSEFIPMPEEVINKSSELTVIPITHRGSGHFYQFEPLPEQWIEDFAGKEVSTPLRFAWCLEHWGTERDMEGGFGKSLLRKRATEVQLLFLTSRTPPIPVFNYWVDLGYEVLGSMEHDSDDYSLVYPDRRVARLLQKWG
jgi:hypothetical protein